MFNLKIFSFYFGLSNLCKLILKHLKILLGFEYLILLVLQLLFLIDYCLYYLIEEELTHDLIVTNTL